MKTRCPVPASATAALRYRQRVLWMGDLLAERDPNLVDLCEGHADRLTAPYGWTRVDERTAAAEPSPAALRHAAS